MTDIIIFMNSYNTFTYIIILVTNLCLIRSLVYGTELILTQILHLWQTYSYSGLPYNTYLSLSPIGHILILISRRSSQNLCLYRDTLRYYKVYTYTIGLILILWRLHLFGGTRRNYRDITERILVLWNLSLYGSTRKYYKTYTGTLYLILVLRSISWSYGTYTCITELILVFQILYFYYRTYTCISDLILVL